MGSWVALTALQHPFAVSFEGVDRGDARHFVESWEWCEAREVEAAPEGATIIRASVREPASREPAAQRVAALAASVGEGDASAAAPEADEHRASAPTYRALADQLSGLITRLAIDERRGELLMFHAGGVADRETGDVIAFIGPSGRGKTTASIALGKVFDYVTDETLAVQDDLGVLAYGKPLSVKQPPPEYYKDQVSPTALGLNKPSGALQLVGVVMLDRQPDHAGAPSVRAVGVAESVEELVPQISYLPERQRPLRRLVEVLAACGGLRAVTYGEAATLPDVFARLFVEARAAGDGAGALGRGGLAPSGAVNGSAHANVQAVGGRLAGGVDARSAVSAGEGRALDAALSGGMDARGNAVSHNALSGEDAVGSVTRSAGAENTDTSRGEMLRAEYADAVRDGESMIVLSGTTVRVLSGIAPTIIEAVELAPRSRSELVDAVVGVHGDPGEGLAEELVGAAVEELVEIGLLAVVGRDE